MSESKVVAKKSDYTTNHQVRNNEHVRQEATSSNRFVFLCNNWHIEKIHDIITN